MHLRDVLRVQQSVGKEGQKGLDPLISEVRVFRESAHLRSPQLSESLLTQIFQKCLSDDFLFVL